MLDIHREIRFTLPLLALTSAQDLPGLSEEIYKYIFLSLSDIVHIMKYNFPTNAEFDDHLIVRNI